MTINIPLSTELLTWWIKNVMYTPEDFSLEAPLPIRLDFGGGQSIDLGKSGIKLSSDFEGEAKVDGHISVSSTKKGAQARMLGLEYLRDSVSFELTDEEKKTVQLMVETACTMINRAVTQFHVDYEDLFNNHNDNDND